MTVTELAPAKLNLTLDVGDRRPDGYHDICSIMHSAALCDTVTLRETDGGALQLDCSGAQLPAGPENLAWRAAEVFFRETALPCPGLHITLEKRIPSQAGLGGGSSDAAAVLRGLRRLYAPELPPERLEAMAARVGSDVPYCVQGGTALATGRGERLRHLPSLPPCCFVIVKPELACSTAEMYRRLDALCIRNRPDSAAMVRALEQGDLAAVCRLVGNVFEQALPPDSVVFTIRRRLRELGAAAACMSGSGSAVMGLFPREADARQAADALQAEFPRTFLAPGV